MRHIPTVFDMLRPSILMGQMMLEAQIVISLRLMGMAGVLPVAKGEHRRMVDEKTKAAQEAGFAAARSLMTGAALPAVAVAAMTPVRRRTRANVRRLTKPAGKRS